MKLPLSYLLFCSTAVLHAAASGQTATARVERIAHLSRQGAATAVRVSDGPLAFTAKLFAPDLSRDPRGQTEAVLAELGSLLAQAGGDLRGIVRLNVYVADESATPAVEGVITSRFAGAAPAVTIVQSALERNGAHVAVDAVAAASKPGSSIEIIADGQAAVLPTGGKVFISGQAQKGADVAASVAQTMAQLQRSLTHLGLSAADVVHVKAFVQPMSAHADVRSEIEKSFGGTRVPPIVMTEWLSSTPAEIELVAHGRTATGKPNDPVAFLPLPEMSTSPYFSRVTTVAAGTPLIYFSAIDGGPGGAPREQWKRVFAELGGALLDAGSSFRHLVKATYYLADPKARQALGEIRGVYYDPARPPAASAADVKSLGRPGAVLLDMIAVPARAESRARK